METRHSGLLFPSKGPTFLPPGLPAAAIPGKVGQRFLPARCKRGCPVQSPSTPLPSMQNLQKLSALIYLFGGGNVQLMQYMDNFGISQARCVILKRQPVVVVHSKAAQTVGVCKCSQRA